MTLNGREICNKEIKYWIREIEERGAGEIMITSIDKDGTFGGFDIELLNFIKDHTNLPLICSGGVGSFKDIKDVFNNGAQAVAIASALHYEKISLREIRTQLLNSNMKVRIIP